MDEDAHAQARHVSAAKRLRRWVPYFLLGPVTGPLAAGVVRSLRARQPLLAGLYAFAVVEAWVVLPLVAHNFAVAASP